jgi:hypothetical protein
MIVQHSQSDGLTLVEPEDFRNYLQTITSA